MEKIATTSDPLQDQSFTYAGYDVSLTLRWNSVCSFWNFDLYDNANDIQVTQSEPLSVGSASLVGSHLPFILLLSDDAGIGTNAIEIDDMGDRINLYIVDKEVYNEAVKQSDSINYR